MTLYIFTSQAKKFLKFAKLNSHENLDFNSQKLSLHYGNFDKKD